MRYFFQHYQSALANKTLDKFLFLIYINYYQGWCTLNSFIILSLLTYIYLKKKYEVFDQTSSNRIFLNYISMRPRVAFFLLNITLLGFLCAIGFAIGMLFTTSSNRLYGEHCYSLKDCVSNQNLICTSLNGKGGICNCTSTTYFKSLANGCGKFLFIFICNQQSYEYVFFYKLKSGEIEQLGIVY